jgi:hypothetical protein
MDLEAIFKVLKEAHNKGVLDLKHFETDYVIRYSFSISKYKQELYDKQVMAAPSANQE